MDEKTQETYKYYSTQRPIDIGTFPKVGNDPISITNFDKREEVENGSFSAWGFLEYTAPLTEKQIDDYELRAASDNPDKKQEQSTFSIYQVKDGDEARDFRFEPLERLKAAGHSVERGNYEQVCKGTFERGNAETTEILNALFEQFNIALPEDYRGRSMTTSDIIVLQQDGQTEAYYVDSYGFKDVPEFLAETQDA